MNAVAPAPPAPIGLLAELTHRCPLRCPYCSNPLDLERRSAELDAETWHRILGEAAALGVLHVHLSGGEPTLRSDLADIVGRCAALGLYSNLITAGVAGAAAKLDGLAEAGLDHVQLSLQAVDAANAERIGGRPGAQAEKLAFAARAVALGLPLTINAVIHRGNVGEVEAMVDLAVAIGAKRLEIAHTQYYGWGLRNRAALMPSRDEVRASVAAVEVARARLAGRLVIDFVAPDYHARFPKACAGGWGRRFINVTPSGRALPCHAAETIPGLVFPSVRERSLAEIWTGSSAFAAFRGTGWMAEPCRSCDRRERDWGGCRCQALALTGDVAATDPVCSLSPHRSRIAGLATAEAGGPPPAYAYRGFRGAEAGA